MIPAPYTICDQASRFRHRMDPGDAAYSEVSEMNNRLRGIIFPSDFATRACSIISLAGIVSLSILTAATGAKADQSTGSSNSGPVRLARFTVISGDVNWRPDDSAAWSQAARNLPVRQGCQISASNNSRCELQFDDGSYLDMGRGAVVTLSSLYSDADGEYTEIGVRDGTVALRLRKAPSVYQVDTPFVSVDASGPARFRVDTDNGVRVALREGKCVVEGDKGKAALVSGNYLDLPTDQDPYEVRALPPHDPFDDWCASRINLDDRFAHSSHRSYLPDDIALVADDPDDYGDWRYDKKYGRIWHPHVSRADWRPYNDGHWVWVDPFGWTWVSDEPWGWAPYHYGTWIHESYGWGWCPGPRTQYWSPAVVDFCETDDGVAWCPLSPAEVRYPSSLAIGFRNRDWSLFFSIGAAAVYYPTGNGYCAPRPWATNYVNNFTYVNHQAFVNNVYRGPTVNNNRFFNRAGFVPVNARTAAGASFASVSAFGGRGAYRSLPRDPKSVFSRGRFVGAPAGSFAPVAGPRTARPTAVAMTPTRTLRPAALAANNILSRKIHQTANPRQRPHFARQTLIHPPRRAAVAAARPGIGRTPGAVGARPQPGAIAGRVPGPNPRSPRTMPPTRPAGQAGSLAPPLASRPSDVAGKSREQNAAGRARAALGMRPGAHRNLPGKGSPRPPAVAAGNAHRPVSQSVQRIGTAPSRPGGNPAAHARSILGAGPRAQANAKHGNRGGRQAAVPAPTKTARKTASRQVASAVRPVPGGHGATPSPRGHVNPAPVPQHRAPNRVPAIQRNNGAAHQRPSPAHGFSTPVRQRPASIQNHARQALPPQARRTAAPVRPSAPPPMQRRQAPAHNNMPPRYAAPQRRAPAPPPMQQRQARVRSYAPPQQRQAPARPNPPQGRPQRPGPAQRGGPPAGHGGNGGNNPERHHRGG